jgi:predicted dehydrogenase
MKTVRIGLLGCGGFMRQHVNRLAPLDEARIVALCDVSLEHVEQFRQDNFDGDTSVACFNDPAQMYAEADLDAVFIATPHTMHFDHGMQALEAGCHVYMEKPMVTDAEQAYKLAEKASRSGKIMVVGYNTSNTPAFAWIRQAIRDKTLGELELVQGFLSQGWMKATAGKWRQDPALSGGGQAYDSGAHIFNSLIWSVESRPAEVFAFVDNRGTQVDINSVCSIRFENGVLANMTISGNCPANSSFMTFIFDNGRVDVNGWNGSWMKVWKENAELELDLPGEATTPTHNFIDAILGKSAPKTTPVNGIHQTELMDAIYESARTGKPATPKSPRET